MRELRKEVYRLRRRSITPEPINYCATWSAQNESNIRMSTTGILDFTAELGSRTINTTPGVSVGTITAYKFAGDPVWVSSSISIFFIHKKPTWDKNTLPVRTDQVLTGIRFSVEIICNDASEISLVDNELFAEVTGSPQLIASYDSCESGGGGFAFTAEAINENTGRVTIQGGEPNETINILFELNIDGLSSFSDLTFTAPITVGSLESIHTSRNGTMLLDSLGFGESTYQFNPYPGFEFTTANLTITGRSSGLSEGIGTVQTIG